jgi:hypothetical protein
LCFVRALSKGYYSTIVKLISLIEGSTVLVEANSREYIRGCLRRDAVPQRHPRFKSAAGHTRLLDKIVETFAANQI